MKKIWNFIIIICCLSSCAIINDSGTVRCCNNSSDPYELTIDGTNQQTIPAHKFVDVYVKKGWHKLSATQLSGYMFYPTVIDKEMNIEVGSEWTLTW